MLYRWHSVQDLSLKMPTCHRPRLGGFGVPPECVLAVAGRNKVSGSWLWLCSGTGFMPSFCRRIGCAKNVLLLPIYCFVLLEIFYQNHKEEKAWFHFQSLQEVHPQGCELRPRNLLHWLECSSTGKRGREVIEPEAVFQPYRRMSSMCFHVRERWSYIVGCLVTLIGSRKLIQVYQIKSRLSSIHYK